MSDRLAAAARWPMLAPGRHARGIEVDAVCEHVRRRDEAARKDTGVVADADLNARSHLPGDRRDGGQKGVL